MSTKPINTNINNAVNILVRGMPYEMCVGVVTKYNYADCITNQNIWPLYTIFETCQCLTVTSSSKQYKSHFYFLPFFFVLKFSV